MILFEPASAGMYEVEPSRFRLKSLNLQNFKLRKQCDGDTLVEHIRIGWSKHDLLLIIYDPSESKRVPSRLLRHIKEEYGADEPPRVFLFSYDSKTKAQTKRWVYTTFGIMPDLFEDVVDEYKAVKGAVSTRKKIAKVKVFNTMNGMNGYWGDHDGDLNLDSNRGVYVDLRRQDIHGTEYRWLGNNTLTEVSNILIEFDLIPEGGQLYGCPGSHKNKLADHSNYIHLDDAISMILEGAKSLFSVAERTRLNYLVSLNTFVKGNNDTFSLDIDVKGSYYNSYRDRVAAYEDSVVSITPNIETYYSAKRLGSILRLGDQHETYKDYEDEIEAKFNKKYPILRAVHTRRTYYDDEDQTAALLTDLQEYIQFKTTNP